jgi:putative spermidine/putrescine transport system permease protein
VAPALLLLVIAFILPVGTMVPVSVRPYVPLIGITGGFTARHYVKLVTDSYYLEIIGRTLGLRLIVRGSTLVIAYPLSSAPFRCRRGRSVSTASRRAWLGRRSWASTTPTS